MFTGIIEEVGKLKTVSATAQGARMTVTARTVTEGVRLGESIAINGVCLTVIEFTDNSLAFDISAETLARSTLGRLGVGSPVNLERAMRVNDRLGGHIVQGHVDARGEFLSRRNVGDSVVMRFSYPAEIGQYICLKGSIAVEGISLTVAALGDGWFEVAIIPHTLKMTNLNSLAPGDAVNLEADILAKYIERMLTGYREGDKPRLTLDRMKELGY